MASGFVVAVVGATGAVGQTTLKILEERKFPVRELRAFASERSVGKTVTFKGEKIRVEKVGPEAFKGVQVALFSAGSAQSKEYAPLAVKSGAVVVDKSSAFRMDPSVPLVVPEINAHAIAGHRGIVACPNCTTIVTVMPLKPLHDVGRLRRVIATSYQAVSGAGVKGVEELRRALFELIPAATPVAAEEGELADYVVYRPRPAARRRYRIFRTDRGYRVSGRGLDAVPEDELRDALRSAGARPGDEVTVGERTYQFV